MSIFVSMGNMCVPKGSFAKPLGIRLFVPVGRGLWAKCRYGRKIGIL